MTKTPKLVIFDCDGVLVDSEPLTIKLLRDDLAHRGLDMPLDALMQMFVGGTMKSAGQKAATMGADIPADWTDQIYAKMYARLAEGVDLIDGVAELFELLDANGIAYCSIPRSTIASKAGCFRRTPTTSPNPIPACSKSP
jgi:beta-phosphoglucomutase-like phosphatase (HAD superfamily)